VKLEIIICAGSKSNCGGDIKHSRRIVAHIFFSEFDMKIEIADRRGFELLEQVAGPQDDITYGFPLGGRTYRGDTEDDCEIATMTVVIGKGDRERRAVGDLERLGARDNARDIRIGGASKAEREDCSFEADHLTR